jgi:AcrR family transcriptional regulator
MSQDDAERIVAAAQRLRIREGATFTLTQLARPAGMSRATLYRRLSADSTLATEVERIRTEGARTPKDELLCAATALLTERGLSELTMDAVAERAGLSVATLYRTFVDRETLVREVLSTSLPAEPLRNILSSNDPMPDVLIRFVDALLHRMQEQPYLLRFLLTRTKNDAREFRKIRRDEERMSTALITFIERHRCQFAGTTSKQIAAALMGQVLGAVLFQRAHDGFVVPQARSIVKLFLDGACHRKSERNKP